jgi:molybdopterin synthase sulfur carrier subunit
MPVTVRIPTPLRPLTQGKDEVAVEAATVAELLVSLENAYPGFREKILDANGKVRRFVNLYLNDEDIRFLQNLDTKIHSGDQVTIVPAIAGGR